MDYFRILNLSKEPFSNSPDPHFFFHSKKHLECMQKIEISLRLRRGLSVIIGDVGTGKTTLCRHLISKFAKDEKIESHLILDPHFSSPSEFLYAMGQMFGEHEPEDEISDWQLRESIKKYLLRRCVDEEKTVVLIIDEGQKIPGFCLEILREFLNYEANEYKLLQIIIFAQEEFEQTLKKYRNFTDRIDLFHILGPLSFSETRSMIRFRLESASEGRGASLFSFLALLSIYRASKGYPRRIINLCHQIILSLIIQNRSKAGWPTTESCVKRLFPEQSRQRTRLGVLTCLLLGVILFGLVTGSLTNMISREKEPPSSYVFTGEKKGMPPVIKNAATPTNAKEIILVAHTKTVKSHDKKIPDLLGQITVKRGETVWGMIKKTYGTFTIKYLRYVSEENPQIENIDLIEPGQVVRFPAIPMKISPSQLKFWWVQVTQKERLKNAFQFLRDHANDALPFHIIPCWNSREGIRFIIVYKGYFPDEISARNSINELPPTLVSGAKILTEWGLDTVFFANPLSDKA